MSAEDEQISQSPNTLSTDQFRSQIERDLRIICQQREWNYDTESCRGFAFQFWIANLLRQRDAGIDTDVEDGVLLTRDGGIDILLEDSTNKSLYLVQTKFVSLAARPPVQLGEVEEFFAKHELLLDRLWYKTHVSERIKDIIGYYDDLLNREYRVYFYFITTGRDDAKKAQITAESYSKRVKDRAGVEFTVLDFSGIKELYIEAQTLEQSVPTQVQFMVPSDKCFLKDRPRRTLVASIKANTLVDLYRAHRESLFAYNIRSFLGRKGLNKDIIDTAETMPSDFFYFNNGISAICTKLFYDKESGRVIADKFQIINGAQTIGALRHSVLSGNVEILARITEGENVVTEKGFNADVIKYNNTQNVVKSSDFRANDEIQLWLEKKFNEIRAHGAIAGITYFRKRTAKRARRNTERLSLEELAKIRFAWYAEPTRCVADPKSLWTYQEDGGVYETSFGVNGGLKSAWIDDDFEETLAAIVFSWEIETRIENLRKKDKEFTFLRRLRFFAISMASDFVRNSGRKGYSIVASRQEFEQFFNLFWKDSRRELNSCHHTFVEDASGTLFALARSEKQWTSLKARYSRLLKMQESD